jgi:DNA-binding NarL/FixJ family response regulator
VAVDDHRRIVGIDLSRSGLMRADSLRVVVAEDDDQLAELITSLLSDDDRFEVVGRARTGDEAVELAGEHRPDIVVMDLAMPGCDGVEATRLIRSLNAEQHVVIYTGSGDYDDVRRALDAGAAGFLHKDAVTSGEIGDALDVLHRNYLRGDDTVEA